MKRIKVELKLTNLDDEVSVSQKKAGALPIFSSKFCEYLLDGETHEEQLYKLYINLLASYSMVYDGQIDEDKFLKWVDSFKRDAV